MRNLIVYIFLFFIFTGCEKSTPQQISSNDYLIFGYYFGECIGDCTTLFKIEDEKIYIDDIEYPFITFTDATGNFSHQTAVITFAEEPLAKDYYEVSKHLFSELPVNFFDLSEQSFGNPDGHDQGGIYLEIEFSGEKKIWMIDPENSFSKPKIAVEYKAEIIKTLSKIRSLQAR